MVVGQVLVVRGFVLNVPIRNRTASRPCTLRTEWAGYHAAAAAAARLPLSPPVDCMFQTNGRTVANHPIRATAQAPETRLSTLPSTRQEVLQRAVPEKPTAPSCGAAQRAEATVVSPHGQLDRSIALFPFGAYGYRP